MIAAGTDLPLYKSLLRTYAENIDDMLKAKSAIDKPEAVTRMVFIDAVKQFVRLTGRPPRLLYIPKALEASLQVDAARSFDRHGKLRECDQLFKCKVIWDADEFKVE